MGRTCLVLDWLVDDGVKPGKEVGQDGLFVRRGDHAEGACCAQGTFGAAAVAWDDMAVDDDSLLRAVDRASVTIGIFR